MFHLRLIGWNVGLFLCLSLCLQAHEGHHSSQLADTYAMFSTDSFFFSNSMSRWLGQIGRFHFLLLHFPIALIIMTVVAEWLKIWFENALFDHAARFMIIAAAIFALPTALLGLALGYDQSYSGIALDLYTWHRYFGLVTACLSIITAILRECYVRAYTPSLKGYYVCLFILFLCINITGVFGGSLAFGLDVG